MTTRSWLDALLYSSKKILDGANAELPDRGATKFTGSGVTVSDDAANNRTIIDIAAGAGGGPPTFPQVASALAGANADISLNNFRLTSVATPVHADPGGVVANKAYAVSRVAGRVSVKDFGAVGNDTVDDLAAIHAAIAYARNPANNVSEVYFPPGKYYCSGDLIVDAPIRLQGAGVAWFRESQMSVVRFAAYKGVRTRKSVCAPNGGVGGDYSQIRNLVFEGAHDHDTPSIGHSTHPVWQASTAVSLGAKRLPTNTRVIAATLAPAASRSFAFTYECIQAGTTGATEPNWQDEVIGFWPDRTAGNWAANASVFWGHTVRIASRPSVVFVSVFSAGAGAQLFSTTPVSTGASQPAAFATAAIGDVIADNGARWLCADASSMIVTDGSVVWARRAYAGIDVMSQVTVEGCAFMYFLNNAIHAQCLSTFNNTYATNLDPHLPYPQSNCNVSLFSTNSVVRCGGGVFFNGADANACFVEKLNLLMHGGGLGETRVTAIEERSFLGNYYAFAHMSGTGGPAIYARGAVNSSCFYGIYVEGDCGPTQIYGSSIAVLPGGFKGTISDDSYFHGAAGVNDWRGVGVSVLSNTNAFLEMQFRPDTNNLLSIASSHGGALRLSGDSSWMGEDGWFSFQSSNSRSSLSFSVQRASIGHGNVGFQNGFVVGPSADRRFTFGSDAGRKDQYIRFGRRVVGDNARANAWAVRGENSERVCVKAGYEPVTNWTASTQRYQMEEFGNFSNGGDIVQSNPDNGFAYVCARTGITGATQPTWPTTIGPFAVCFNPYMRVSVGQLLRPSAPNGASTRIYQVQSIVAGDSVQMLSVEPSWSNGAVGTTFTDASGVTFLVYANDNAAHYVADGGALWITVARAGWSEASPIAAKAAAVTTGTATATIDTYPDLPESSVRRYRVRVHAHDLTNNEVRSWIMECTYRRGTGAVTAVQVATVTQEASNATSPLSTGTAPAFSVVGNAVSVTVSGVTGRTLVWSSELLAS